MKPPPPSGDAPNDDASGSALAPAKPWGEKPPEPDRRAEASRNEGGRARELALAARKVIDESKAERAAERALEKARPARRWAKAAAVVVIAALSAGVYALFAEDGPRWALDAARSASSMLAEEERPSWQDVGAALEAFAEENERLKRALAEEDAALEPEGEP